MKKFLAFIMTCLLLATTAIRAAGSNKTRPNETVTLEVIQSATSWDDIIKLADNTYDYDEDKYISMLIKVLDSPKSYNIYHLPYFEYTLNRISIDTIDVDRLYQKFYAVYFAYQSYENKYNFLVSFRRDCRNPSYMNLLVIEDSTLSLIPTQVNAIGQTAIIKPNYDYGRYFESADESGASATLEENYYVEPGDIVHVDGVAYLDENGYILSSSFENGEAISITSRRMLHIRGEKTEIGWCYPENLVFISRNR